MGWNAGRSIMEATSFLEAGQPEGVRCCLEQVGSQSLPPARLRGLEVCALGIERNWAGVSDKGRQWLANSEDPGERAFLASWIAVATIYQGQDPAEAERYCDILLSIIPWEPSSQTVLALVRLRKGETTKLKPI